MLLLLIALKSGTILGFPFLLKGWRLLAWDWIRASCDPCFLRCSDSSLLFYVFDQMIFSRGGCFGKISIQDLDSRDFPYLAYTLLSTVEIIGTVVLGGWSLERWMIICPLNNYLCSGGDWQKYGMGEPLLPFLVCVVALPIFGGVMIDFVLWLCAWKF